MRESPGSSRSLLDTPIDNDISEERRVRPPNETEVHEQKMLTVLKLGTGMDGQEHVTRPRTAIQQAKDTLMRVDS